MVSTDRYHLEVDKKELTNALRQITKFKKRKGKGEMLMLSFEHGVLRFSMANASVGIDAVGAWPADVFVPAASIYGLARVPLSEEKVEIVVEGDWLKIGSSAMRVEWQAH
ncbi:MAG TPA: hypothetical protein VMX94_06665 [Armatimonadota bacterium]|nr:hypothetical protein [Armatimonadota bacterium]